MKLFYVAADYARKEDARALSDALIEGSGGELACSARWIYDQPQHKDGGLGGELDDEDAKSAARVAMEDLEDIASADIFIQLTTGEKARGGRQVELGYAFAIAQSQAVIATSPEIEGAVNPLLIMVVGPREHVFHYHPTVVHVSTENTVPVLLSAIDNG